MRSAMSDTRAVRCRTLAPSLASRLSARCRARSPEASNIVTDREPLKPELQDPMPPSAPVLHTRPKSHMLTVPAKHRAEGCVIQHHAVNILGRYSYFLVLTHGFVFERCLCMHAH